PDVPVWYPRRLTGGEITAAPLGTLAAWTRSRAEPARAPARSQTSFARLGRVATAAAPARWTRLKQSNRRGGEREAGKRRKRPMMVRALTLKGGFPPTQGSLF